MHKIRKIALAVALLCCITTAHADEGMWPLYGLDQLDFDALQARGLTLGPEDIYNAKNGGLAAAICQVGGGTGSFVSPQGLIITNHHVAFGAIQKQSTVDQNILKTGFIAKSQTEEIPAIGYNCYVTRSFEDVTERMKAAVTDDMTDVERYDALDQREKEIISEAEKAGDVRCRIVSNFGGLQYYLVTTFRIQDVRIVQCPPQAIGEFGGDIDNWMWPRHTGDFSFMRAYVAPDGSSAEYSEENVPYQPARHLAISTGPLGEGDFAMILGYPGRTMRHRSSYSIAENLNYGYPRTVRFFTDVLDILGQRAAADPEAQIKLAGRMKGLNNYLKNTQGMLRGLKRSGLLAKKRKQEAELAAWIAGSELNDEYGNVLPGLAELYAGLAEHRDQDNAVGSMSWMCRYYSYARQLYKWSVEKTKPDMEREARYMDRQVKSMKRDLREGQVTLDEPADRALFSYVLMDMMRLPADQRVPAVDKHFPMMHGTDTLASLEAMIGEFYRRTRLGDADERLRLFDMTTEDLLALDDPFINLAHDMNPLHEQMRERDKAFEGAVEKLRPKLNAAYAKWQPGAFYPDANGTIRFTYGEVKGYSPGDAVTYDYLTTLSGVVEKETGEEPFANPQMLLAAYKTNDFGTYADARTRDVPVNFLTTNDITGGNSGSPVLNGRGDVIGLAFDGNWESIAADYQFDPPVTRSINVDTRYILYILDKVYHAQSVIDELTIH